MIILIADDNPPSHELIRELLEGSGHVAEKFGFRLISWYRTTLTDLHAQGPAAFGINYSVAQKPICSLFDTGDQAFHGSGLEVIRKLCRGRANRLESIYEIGHGRKVSRETHEYRPDEVRCPGNR